MKKFPEKLTRAVLIKRINRFVAEVNLNDVPVKVYVPNTGRLSELALPGAELLLAPINAKYSFKILYIIDKSFPVMIDSTYSNRLFLELLKRKKVPMPENYSTVRSEPVYGNHRFDFLLSNNDKQLYIELKSCTLFHNTTGAFPDAVSTRATEHVKALAESGIGKLVFLVLKSSIERFLPNYHTDFAFYETLRRYKNKIQIHAFAVQYDHELNIESLKEIPVIIPEVKPSGIFLLVLFNPENKTDEKGEILIKGYYIYCGTSTDNAFKTIASIKKKNGLRSVIQDERFSGMNIITCLPVITDCITEDYAAEKLINTGGFPVKFRDAVNMSVTQMIYFETDPAQQHWFWDIILELRFGRYA